MTIPAPVGIPPLAPALDHASDATERRKIRQVIAASAAGTMIEWYDFFIFGSLSTIIAAKFFPAGNETAAFLNTLATFGVGFAVRPFGALVFGRIGDLVGRKYAFMVTLLIMGGATAAIGLVPSYETIGIAAPLILLVLRMLQGLALGGEYGGAAVYVAEHSPDHQRGYYTSFIQTTATLGLFCSLLVILGCKSLLGTAVFDDWGWRVPFLLSLVLVAGSYYIRTRMQESPVFVEMKAQGKTSKAPIKDSFGTREGWRTFLLVLFGVTAGQAVVWYTGQFYALIFLQKTLKLPQGTAFGIVAAALALGTPFFIVFGKLSDRIGRKPIMMGGMLLAAACYYPIYRTMSAMSEPVSVIGLTALVFVQVLFVTMVYGPIAAYLVELFPAKIRYTSLSLPYHFGNGWFGGFLPLIATALTTRTGNPYAGLIFPIVIAVLSAIIGMVALRETAGPRGRSFAHE
jgi:MFS family permease